jgi:predicted ATPase
VNLVAGKRAVAKCAFGQGAEFLQVAAIVASKADLWTHDYDLALDVFTSSAEYESNAVRLERSYEMANVVVMKATTLEDKSRAYYVRLDGLVLEERLDEAVDLGLMLLQMLGEKMTRQLTTLQVVRKTMKISWLMRRRGMFDVGTLDEMNDWKIIAAMRVLSLLWGTAWYSGDTRLFVSITLKSMSLTLKWGLSPFSASALATFALLLMGIHRADESYRVGQLALEVHKKCGSKENEGFLLLLLASFINHARETCRDQLPLISRAHDSAFASGRMSLAMIIVLTRVQANFVVGTPLSSLDQDCKALRRNTACRLAFTCSQPVIQLISCLQDGTPTCNPYALSGNIQNEIEFRALCEASGNERALVLLCTYQIAQAFFFHDWNRAVGIYNVLITKHKEQWKALGANMMFNYLSMWIGISHILLARFDSRYIQ